MAGAGGRTQRDPQERTTRPRDEYACEDGREGARGGEERVSGAEDDRGRRGDRGAVVPVRGNAPQRAEQERRRESRGQERAGLRGREAEHSAGEQGQREVHDLPGAAD